MSITHELREWISSVTWLNDGIHHTCDKITAIADRIDAEHEDAVRKKAAGMLTKTSEYMNDDDLAEIGLVRLPVDADGEYIHIGDVMAYADNTKPMKVVALVPPAVFLTEDGPRYADMCRHHHAPTVEDVLREFTDAILEWSGKSGTVAEVGTWSDVAAEYVAKLRLAGDAE